MGQAQADDAARSALLMEALGAGRIDQALALASKLGDAARARVLVVHEPTSLSYEQLLTLRDAAGLDAVTAQRIKILISALFRSRAPMRPSPPSGVGAMMRYFDAKNTGKPNEFYDVIRVVDPTGEVLYYKAVERPAPAFAEDKPRPAAPPSGSSESAWSAYYSALESW